MKTIKLFFALGFISLLLSNTGCGSDFTDVRLQELQNDGFTVQPVKLYDTESYVAYKVENTGVYFNSGFNSTLTIKSIWYYGDGTSEEAEETYNTGNTYSTIEFTGNPLRYTGGHVYFDYSIVPDGEDEAIQKTVGVYFPY